MLPTELWPTSTTYT